MNENKLIENNNIITGGERLSLNSCVSELIKECARIKELENRLLMLNVGDGIAAVCTILGGINLRDGIDSINRIGETLFLCVLAIAIGLYTQEKKEGIEKASNIFYRIRLKNDLDNIFSLLKKIDPNEEFKLIENFFDKMDHNGHPKKSLGWVLSTLSKKDEVQKLIIDFKKKYLKNLNPSVNLDKNSLNSPRSEPKITPVLDSYTEKVNGCDEKNFPLKDDLEHFRQEIDKSLLSKIIEQNKVYSRQNSLVLNMLAPALCYSSSLLSTKYIMAPLLESTPLVLYPDWNVRVQMFLMLASGTVLSGINFLNIETNNSLIINKMADNFKRLSYFEKRSGKYTSKKSLDELIDFFSIEYEKNKNNKINILSVLQSIQKDLSIKNYDAIKKVSNIICIDLKKMRIDYDEQNYMSSDEIDKKLNSEKNKFINSDNEKNEIKKEKNEIGESKSNEVEAFDGKITRLKDPTILREKDNKISVKSKLPTPLPSGLSAEPRNEIPMAFSGSREQAAGRQDMGVSSYVKSKENKSKNKKIINKNISKPIEKDNSEVNEKRRPSYLWDVTGSKLRNKIKTQIKNGELEIAEQLIRNVTDSQSIREIVLFFNKKYDLLIKKQIDPDKIRNFESFLLNCSGSKVGLDQVSDASDDNKRYKNNLPKPPGSRSGDIVKTEQNDSELSEVMLDEKKISSSHPAVNMDPQLINEVDLGEIKTKKDMDDPLFELQNFLQKKISARIDFHGIKQRVEFFYPRDFLLLSLKIQRELVDIFKDKYKKEPLFYVHGGLPRNLFCNLDALSKKNKNDTDFVTSLSVVELIAVLSELKKKCQDISYEVCYQSAAQSLVKVKNWQGMEVDFLCYPNLSLENFPRADYNYSGLILSFDTMEIYDPSNKIDCLIDGALGVIAPVFTIEKGCLPEHNIRDLIPMWKGIISQLKGEEGFDECELEEICKSWIEDYSRIFRLLENIDGSKLFSKNQLTKTMRLCYEDSILNPPLFSIVLSACNQRYHSRKKSNNFEIKQLNKTSTHLVNSAALFFDKIICKLLKKGEDDLYHVESYKKRLIWLMEEACSDKILNKKILGIFEFLNSNDEYANKIKEFLKERHLNAVEYNLAGKMLPWAVGVMLVDNPKKQEIMCSNEEFIMQVLKVIEKVPFFRKVFPTDLYSKDSLNYDVINLKEQIGKMHTMLHGQENSYTQPLDQKNKNPHSNGIGKLNKFWKKSEENNSSTSAHVKKSNPVLEERGGVIRSSSLT